MHHNSVFQIKFSNTKPVSTSNTYRYSFHAFVCRKTWKKTFFLRINFYKNSFRPFSGYILRFRYQTRGYAMLTRPLRTTRFTPGKFQAKLEIYYADTIEWNSTIFRYRSNFKIIRKTRRNYRPFEPNLFPIVRVLRKNEMEIRKREIFTFRSPRRNCEFTSRH